MRSSQKKTLIADYILVFKGIKLAVVEAKNNELEVGEGVAMQVLGKVSDISSMFIEFQKHLYLKEESA